MTSDFLNAPTIATVAKQAGIPRRTMFRRLMMLHGKDRQDGECYPWLYRDSGGPWRVNVSRLRRAHPELFAVASSDDLELRIRRLERQMERLDQSHRRLLRKYEKRFWQEGATT